MSIPTQLPLFEGTRPDLAELKLSGAVGYQDSKGIGESIFLVVVAKVIGVNHEEKGKDKILVRSHKLDVDSAVVISEHDAAQHFAQSGVL